jgi:hypothetical protein
MNIAQLKLSQKKLLDNLVSRGYDIQYIKGVKFVLRLLFEHEGCFHSYEQFAEKFIRTRGYTKATLDLRMMHLRTIQAYDEFGHYPDKKSFVPLCYPSRYNMLNPSFQKVIDIYRKRAAEHKKKSTVKMETNTVTMFLFEMQKFHVSSLDEIKEEHVLSFFLKEEQQKRSRTYCGHIASALKELGAVTRSTLCPSVWPSSVSAPSLAACSHTCLVSTSYLGLESDRDPWRATSSVNTGLKPVGAA